MRYFILLLFVALSTALAGQEAHKITVIIEGYDQDVLSLANNVLDKQYIVDTAARTKDGLFVFESDTSALPKGIYLVVLAPDNAYFQLVIGDDPDQEFTLRTAVDDLAKVKVTGSLENELFFDYLSYLDGMSEKSAPYRDQLKDTTLTDAQRDPIMEKLTEITAEVNAEQARVISTHPGSFVAAIIRVNQPNDPPAYEELPAEDRNTTKLEWLRNHYFDPIDLKDDRLLRTPFLFGRINYFVDKLFVQHPDTLSGAIDGLLSKMDPTSEMFKYYVVHFTNKAASSKIVGMDALYVHMIDTYYKSGKAYWSDPEQLATMIENADKSRPLLIGKQAPDMAMKRRDGTDVNLYDIKANYTILYFWQFACPSCKKSTPVMKEFYAKWKDRGVEIFSICTKQGEIDKCWDYIDEQEIGDWMHATDRYQRFYKNYDVRSTPSIFVLDENKKIVSKRIGAGQLDELLTALEEAKELEKSTNR